MRCLILTLLLASSCWADEISPDKIRAAITKALPLIEAGSRGSADERRCFTCHNQGLPMIALVRARERGFEIDAENLKRQADHTLAHLDRGKASYEKGVGQGGKVDTAAMALWALEETEVKPAEALTTAMIDFILTWNKEIPHWRPQSDRPPSEGSWFTSTYLALRALRDFGGEQQHDEIEKRRVAALKWLQETEPEETEDAVFRLRALHLLEADTTDAAKHLLTLQRYGGGWGQQPELNPESYSTGSALVALHYAGGLGVDAETYKAGLTYLLETQLEDGSWKVVTRSRPIQKYYESGFPHGKDQFLSSASSCWAVLALLNALPEP